MTDRTLRIMTRLSVLGLLAFLISSPLSAQTGEDVLRFGQRDAGQTPRMVGLAGTGAGGVGDWGATVANPAALALARVSHVTGSLDVTSVQSEAEVGGQTARITRFSAGHGAYVAALPTARGAFVVGLGAHRSTTLDRRLFFQREAAGERGELYESGYLAELSGVAAIEMAPSVFVGASFNAVFGDYAFTEFGFSGPSMLESTGLEASMRGFNLRGGLVAEVLPGFRLGLSAESPTWLHVEETFGLAAGQREYFNYTVQTPWRATAGAVYQFEDLLFAVDLIFSDWAQSRLRPSTTFVDENRDIQRFFRETVDLRLGAEYDFGLGAVRAGYGFGQDPLRDELDIDRLRHTFASGVSFYVRPGITLDLGFSFTEFRDQVFPIGGGPVVEEQVGQFRAVAGLHLNL